MLRHAFFLTSFAAVLACSATAQGKGEHQSPGYTDTPIIPGQTWHVHDPARPHPTVVDPGPAGAPVPVPSDAVVLLGPGEAGLGAWTSNGEAARWTLADGVMEVNGTGDIQTRSSFGDCQLHLEWASPVDVKGESQGRGNSGVFFFGRYEVQVLDSYENVTYADGQAAALYGQFPPEVNACRKPGEWQTYDIVFRAPRFDGEGKLVSPAVVTVVHNGVLVHDHRALLGPTAHRSVTAYHAHEAEGPIRLQDHGNPVRYRNIWIRSLAPLAAK